MKKANLKDKNPIFYNARILGLSYNLIKWEFAKLLNVQTFSIYLLTKLNFYLNKR